MQTLLPINSLLKYWIATKVTIACYESCTGGALANLLTNHPGASVYFKGGAVVYSAAAKIKLAGLSKQFLHQHTTVAIATSHALAKQCYLNLKATINIGITGYLETMTTQQQSVVYVCFKFKGGCIHRIYYPDNMNRDQQKHFVLEAIINDLNSDLIKSKIKSFV